MKPTNVTFESGRTQLQDLETFLADGMIKNAACDDWIAVAQRARSIGEQEESVDQGMATIEDMATAIMLAVAANVSASDDIDTSGDAAAKIAMQTLLGQLDSLEEKLRLARQSGLDARSRETYHTMKIHSLDRQLADTRAARTQALVHCKQMQLQVQEAQAQMNQMQNKLKEEGYRENNSAQQGAAVTGGGEMDERDFELMQISLQLQTLKHENQQLHEQKRSIDRFAGGKASQLIESQKRLLNEVERLKDENEVRVAFTKTTTTTATTIVTTVTVATP